MIMDYMELLIHIPNKNNPTEFWDSIGLEHFQKGIIDLIKFTYLNCRVGLPSQMKIHSYQKTRFFHF